MLPSALALLLFAACLGLYRFSPPRYYDVLDFYAVNGSRQLAYPPFLDLRFVTAGIDCWEKGVDVYVSDPCDPLGRPQNYSPLWLRAGFLFPADGWTNLYGVALDVAFLLSLAFLPPARRKRELAFTACAVLSPPVVFAVERANIDLIMFMMILAAAALWTRGFAWRSGGYALVLLTGLLKFYPLIVLGLGVRERPKALLALTAVSTAVVAAFVGQFHNELVAMAAEIPTGSYFGDMFGAVNLPRGVITILAQSVFHRDPALMAWTRWASLAVEIGLLTVAATQIVMICRWTALRRTLANAPAFDMATGLFGAAIIVGCFFAGQSVGYRGIYLVLVIPGLLALWRASGDREVRAFALLAACVALFLLWQTLFTWPGMMQRGMKVAIGLQLGSSLQAVLWFAREIAWWWLCATLSGLLVAFALDAQAELLHRLRHGMRRDDRVASA